MGVDINMDKKATQKELGIIRKFLNERINIIDARTMEQNQRLHILEDKISTMEIKLKKSSLLDRIRKWMC